MNKYILTLTSTVIFLSNASQFMSMHPLNREQQLQLNEHLVRAAVAGDKDTLIALLEQGADVKYEDDNGWTALMRAAHKGHTNIVRMLIEHDADVNYADDYGNSVLTLATRYGHINIVRILIEAGANLNYADYQSETPLIMAAKSGYTNIIKLLIEHGAYINHIDYKSMRAVVSIARCGSMEIVGVLMRYGAIIAPSLLAENRDWVIQVLKSSGISSLALAIITRDIATVTQLLSDNSIGAQDNFGMTALHWAVAQNYGELVALLLNEYNPNLSIQDHEGNTALHYAVRNGNDLILQVLLAHDARIDVQNAQGNTPLHLAAQAGRLGMVQSLIRHDSATVNFVNRVNNRGLSAWLLARGRNYRDIEQLLEPMAGQALLNLLSTEGQQGRFGVLYTDNDTNGTAQTLGVLPDGVLPAEIAAHIARFVVAQRPPAQVRSNLNSN